MQFFSSVTLCPCRRECWSGRVLVSFALSVSQKHRPSLGHSDIGNRSDRNKQWGGDYTCLVRPQVPGVREDGSLLERQAT
jgi:hypothetical protein